MDATASHSVAAPARYFWLKRLLPLAILYVLLLLGVRLWWGWEAQRRFDAAVARWRALGQPVFAEDFDRVREPRRDPHDEAIIAEFAQLTALSSKDDEWLCASGMSVEAICRRPVRFAEVHAQLEPARRRLYDLRDPCGPVWGPTVEDFAQQFGVQVQFGALRRVGKAASEAAVLAHALGDDAAAAAALDEALRVDRVVRGGTPCLITSLIQMAVSSLAADAAREISFALRVGPPGTATGVGGAASRSAVTALIRDYLDDGAFTRAFHDGVCAERTLGLAAAASAGGSLPLGYVLPFEWLGWLVTPLHWLEVVRLGEPIAAVAAVTATGSVGQTQVSPALAGWNGSATLRSAVHEFSGTWLSWMDRPRLLLGRALAVRRMAAVALALRLHELDHGVRPATLDALVPEYLDRVPSDPFSLAGRPIGYVIDDAYPRLYSVNVDGVDDGGLFLLRPGGSVDPDAADYVFFLARDYPRSRITLPDEQPLPQAVEDDDQPGEAGGDEDGNEPAHEQP